MADPTQTTAQTARRVLECADLFRRLREVVWLYVDPDTGKRAYGPVIARCVQQ